MKRIKRISCLGMLALTFAFALVLGGCAAQKEAGKTAASGAFGASETPALEAEPAGELEASGELEAAGEMEPAGETQEPAGETQEPVRIFVRPTEFGGAEKIITPDSAALEAIMLRAAAIKKAEPLNEEQGKTHGMLGYGFYYDGAQYSALEGNCLAVYQLQEDGSDEPAAVYEDEALCGILADWVKREGIVPFSEKELTGSVEAELTYFDRESRELEYRERIYQPEELEKLEGLLGNVTNHGDGACPFDEFYLDMIREDGSEQRLAMASDSCNIYFVNGRYFDFEACGGYDSCYGFFPHAPIHSPLFRGTEGAKAAALKRADALPEERKPGEALTKEDLAALKQMRQREAESYFPDGLPEFTKEEIRDAFLCVEEKFKDFRGCDMLRLWYDRKESAYCVRGYMEYGAGAKNGAGAVNGADSRNVIYLFSDFTVDSEKAEESLSLGAPYDGFMWVLTRESGASPWRVESWGY